MQGAVPTTALPDRPLPRQKLNEGVWWQMKHYRVKELPVKGVWSQAVSSGAVAQFTTSTFPRDQLSDPCGQHGAISHLEGLKEAVEGSLSAGPQHHIQQPEFLLPL